MTDHPDSSHPTENDHREPQSSTTDGLSPDPEPIADLTASFELKVRSRSLKVQVTVSSQPISPRVVLPMVKNLVDAVGNIAVEDSTANGKPISCREGCAACCRQPVPLSETEAWALAELVNTLPEPRQTEVRAKFAAVQQRLDEAGIAKATRDTSVWTLDDHRDMGHAYLTAWVDCPFLENEACSIYADRPLVCREYMVTSPAKECDYPLSSRIHRLDLPFGSAFHHFARASGNQPPDSPIAWVLLPHALDWAANHPEPPPDRAGPDLLQSVVQHLISG